MELTQAQKEQLLEIVEKYNEVSCQLKQIEEKNDKDQKLSTISANRKRVQLYNEITLGNCDEILHKYLSLKHQDKLYHTIPLHDGTFFKNDSQITDVIFYLCEYIPSHRNTEIKDLRSTNFVYGFKQMNKLPEEYVVNFLIDNLQGNCVLVAVPPSNPVNNGKTASHKIIRKVVQSIGKAKKIIDGSSCLYRKEWIESAHKGGDRSVMLHKETIALQNTKLLENRNILILDDIVTTGRSFEACIELIKEKVATVKEISCWAVGRTIYNPELYLGFIVDLDGLWFNPSTNIGIEQQIQNSIETPSLIELIKNFKELHAKYCLITHAPENYRTIIASKLNVNESCIINPSDILQYDLMEYPYLLAKQKMQVYEPLITVITNNIKTKKLAYSMGTNYVYIKKDATPSDIPYCYSNLTECACNMVPLLNGLLPTLKMLYQLGTKAAPAYTNIKEYIKNAPIRNRKIRNRLQEISKKGKKQALESKTTLRLFDDIYIGREVEKRALTQDIGDGKGKIINVDLSNKRITVKYCNGKEWEYSNTEQFPFVKFFRLL